MSDRIFSLFSCIFLLALTNCSIMEPLDQSYHWRAHNVYKENIAAQVDNPSDLVKGRPLPASDAHTATSAVQRWHDDRVKKLGNTGLAEVSQTGDGDQSSDTGSASGGNAGSASVSGGE